jgi:hypothetical protein
MPRTNVDYSKTIIYKIVCNDLNITDLYVGSTTHFTRRKTEHRYCCKDISKKNKIKIYETIRNNGNFDNWSIIQIEEFPCANGNEARARERYWYEQLQATLNTQHPNRSQKEKTRANYVKNVERNKEYARNYTLLHKEEILEKNRQSYKLNRDKILEKSKEKRYICECGTECKFYARNKHFNTIKHQSFINAQKEAI